MSIQPATILLERIGAERQRLRTTEDVVLRAGPGAQWLERVAGDRLRILVGNARTRLDALERGVEHGGVSQERLATMAGLAQAIDRVTSECLALAQGALARHFEVDSGACAEADLLIRYLAGRINRQFARPTVPGEQEFLHRAADVVRRRVPDNGLWDLPIMAHEFGHLVASGLQTFDAVGDQVFRPVEAFLAGFDGLRRQQVTELFCDVFATFALGPSYPCALVLHRLDPAADAVAGERDTHPGDAARAHACLWTLRRMQGPVKFAGPYDQVLGQLGTAWADLQRDVPDHARLDENARGALGADLAGCWVALRDNLAAAGYQWSGRVHDLVAELRNSGGTPESAGYCAPDVLNAAWVLRLDSWSAGVAPPAGLEARARDLFQAALAMREER